MPRLPFVRRKKVHPVVAAAQTVAGGLAATGDRAKRAPQRVVGIAAAIGAAAAAFVVIRRRRAEAGPDPAPWNDVSAFPPGAGASPGAEASTPPPPPSANGPGSPPADKSPSVPPPAPQGESVPVPDAPNEGATGHHPVPGDERDEHGAASAEAAEQPNEGATGDHPTKDDVR
jgi:hypothetical protein